MPGSQGTGSFLNEGPEVTARSGCIDRTIGLQRPHNRAATTARFRRKKTSNSFDEKPEFFSLKRRNVFLKLRRLFLNAEVLRVMKGKQKYRLRTGSFTCVTGISVGGSVRCSLCWKEFHNDGYPCGQPSGCFGPEP